jgi:hypothetical protein
MLRADRVGLGLPDPVPQRFVVHGQLLRQPTEALLAADFLETITLTGTRMYFLAVVEHAGRRIRILGATAHDQGAPVERGKDRTPNKRRNPSGNDPGLIQRWRRSTGTVLASQHLASHGGTRRPSVFRLVSANSGSAGKSTSSSFRTSELGVWAQAMAVRRRSSASGASAREHAIAACRRLFDTAIADGYLQHNPAKAVRKPPRAESRRTALTDDQVAEVFRVVRDEETGLLRFLLETACRREGLLALTPEKLHPARQTVLLDEKGSRIREQPVSQLMMGTPTAAHLPHLLLDPPPARQPRLRIRRELAWADEISLSTHWFRHTTINNVERVTRSPVLAATFAGHRLSKFGTTATYIAPYSVTDVAWAFTQAFGDTHPLVTSDQVPRLVG